MGKTSNSQSEQGLTSLCCSKLHVGQEETSSVSTPGSGATISQPCPRSPFTLFLLLVGSHFIPSSDRLTLYSFFRSGHTLFLLRFGSHYIPASGRLTLYSSFWSAHTLFLLLVGSHFILLSLLTMPQVASQRENSLLTTYWSKST